MGKSSFSSGGSGFNWVATRLGGRIQPNWVQKANPIGFKKQTQPDRTKRFGSVRFENSGPYFGLGTIQVTTIQFPEIRQAAT